MHLAPVIISQILECVLPVSAVFLTVEHKNNEQQKTGHINVLVIADAINP